MNGNAPLELDTVTTNLVEHLDHAWGVTKEEAVRRAGAQAAATSSTASKHSRLEAFKELPKRLALTPAKAANWQSTVHEARR